MRSKTRISLKWKITLALVLIITGLQFIRPRIDNPSGTGEILVPPEIQKILKASCYDCHSNETQLKWFDQIVPAYWLVADHIKEGRKALNFSDWSKLAPPAQKAMLFLSFNQAMFGAMPLPQYSALHPGAKLKEQDMEDFKNYLLTLTPLKPSAAAQVEDAGKQYEQWIGGKAFPTGIQPALNGINYIPGNRNWKVISTTDRFDNGTMRVILGNEIAIKAVEEGKINPWPDGTIFAKLAWDKLVDSTGSFHAGAFKQVEFMIRDRKKYGDSKGWGWARWVGAGLKPYGKDALFSAECQGCHQPMKDNDYVFTMPISFKPGLDPLYNRAASLSEADSLSFNPLGWTVITTSGNAGAHTMATLYGNEKAAGHAGRGAPGGYPEGAILCLVTWAQQADKHWFGGKIPGQIQSVEVLRFGAPAASKTDPMYEIYTGSPLRLQREADESAVHKRVSDILNQKASVIP